MNNLKHLLLILFLFTTVTFHGQERPSKDKIKALKVAFMTERLDLGSKEAQTFWPLYNEYQENREALRQREYTQIRAKIKDADALSEKEAKKLLDQYISFEEEEEALDKAFLNDVSQVITAKKTLLLLRSEEEFKRQLIKQYRQKYGGGGYR